MPKSKKSPARLYKYRSFSNLALEMLVADHIYFADASSFNDPLDTKPILRADVGAEDIGFNWLSGSHKCFLRLCCHDSTATNQSTTA